jgi:hypothetical protein
MRKAKQYILFNNYVINPDLYEGRDTLVNRSSKPDDCEQYTNPRSSFYLCKKLESSTPF